MFSNLLHDLYNSFVIHFYCLENLEQMTSKQEVVLGTLNLITNPPLTLTKQQFKRFLTDIADFLLAHPNFHICLTTTSIIPSLPTLHCWCKRNEMLCLFDNKSPNVLYLSEDISFVNTTADFLDDLYQSSHFELKLEENVANLLKKI